MKSQKSNIKKDLNKKSVPDFFNESIKNIVKICKKNNISKNELINSIDMIFR